MTQHKTLGARVHAWSNLQIRDMKPDSPGGIAAWPIAVRAALATLHARPARRQGSGQSCPLVLFSDARRRRLLRVASYRTHSAT